MTDLALERDLVADLRLCAKQMGAFLVEVGQRKAKGSGTTVGCPDLFLFCAGQVAPIEVKRPKLGTISLGQQAFIERAAEQNVTVHVVDNVTEFAAIVNGMRRREWETMKYRTIVADPPWEYGKFGVGRIPVGTVHDGRGTPMPYPMMSVDEIAALPVADMAEDDAHLYLWTTTRYLHDAFHIVGAWGFKYSTTLVWAKTPMPTMIGGAYRPSAEFILFSRRGHLAPLRREVTQWFNWKRQRAHSQKPDAALDVFESVSPGPYLEMFARRQRLGWDTWGNECFEHVEMTP